MIAHLIADFILLLRVFIDDSIVLGVFDDFMILQICQVWLMIMNCTERKPNLNLSYLAQTDWKKMHDIKLYRLKAIIIENISEEHDIGKLLVRYGYGIRW